MQVVFQIIQRFVAELRAGGPQAGAADAKPSTSAATAAPAAAAAPAKPKPAAPKASVSISPSARRSLELKEKFFARPVDLFECFVNENRIKGFTQSNAIVQAVPGGTFMMFSGSITGTVEEVEVPSRLVMKWRFSNWAEDCFSRVVLEFKEPEPGTTFVHVHHTDIPVTDKFGTEGVIDNVQRGWNGQIFQRIKAVFGYGA